MTNSSPSFAASGGAGRVNVSAARECTWTSETTAPWIQLTSAKNGQGDGSIDYRVTANPDPVSRSGAILIGDFHADVAQAAAQCSYTVSSPDTPVAAAGGSGGTIDVRTHPVCAWSATSSAPWAALTPSSGKGDAQIAISVQPNGGAERTVTLTVGGQNVTMRQLGAPPAPTPPPPTPAPAPPAPTPTPTPTPAPTPTPTPTPTPPPPPPAPTPPPPTPTPTPTPPPPPPPPPAPPPPVTVDVSGRIDDVHGRCPSVTFRLQIYSVTVNSATVITRGSCRDLDDGRSIAMTGEVQGGNNLLAKSIEIRK